MATPAPAVFPFPLAQRRVARRTAPPLSPATDEKPGAEYHVLPPAATSSGAVEPPGMVQRSITTPGPRHAAVVARVPAAADRLAASAPGEALRPQEPPRLRASAVPIHRQERHESEAPSRRVAIPQAPPADPVTRFLTGAGTPSTEVSLSRRVVQPPERTGSVFAPADVPHVPARPAPPQAAPAGPGTSLYGQIAPAAPGPSEVLQRVAAAPVPARPLLPMAPPPARQVVQRVEEPVGSVTKVEPAPEAAAPPDIDRIAERVWKKFKRDLRVERERERGMP